MTADLHLVVEPAEELEVAVGQAPHDVAGAVHARSGLRRERIGQEALGGELGAVEVPDRHAGAADVELTRLAWVDGSLVGVEDVEDGPGDRPPDAGRQPPPPSSGATAPEVDTTVASVTP